MCIRLLIIILVMYNLNHSPYQLYISYFNLRVFLLPLSPMAAQQGFFGLPFEIVQGLFDTMIIATVFLN